VEASTLQAPAGLARHRIAIGIPLLRLRSDEQLVALFRAGHDEAFRVIHDRYEKRLLAYTRQMLPRRHDAEDALQDVFVRAYSGLRSSERELALRAWLFRVAHNRCIDELRRPPPPPPEVLQLASRTAQDPVAEADRRESLRRLIADVRRLPDQQRSALLMREMGGMSYAELATTLGTSVPAVKSLLVRARIALVQAAAARDTACSEIREELVGAHDRGVRPNANAKRHIRDCAGCRSFKRELRTLNRRVAALAPLGPLALVAKTLGFSGGAGAGSGATASGAGAGGATAGGATAGGATAGGAAGGATALGGAAGGGSAIAGGALVVGTGHVATLLAAAVATAGGAVAISAPSAHHVRPPANVRSAADPLTDGGSGLQAAATQDAAATAVGVSLLDQSKAAVATQAARARIKHKPSRTAPASSSSKIPATTAPTTTSSTDGTSTDPSAGTTLGTTLSGSTDPSATGTSTGTGSSTDSSGTGTPSGTDTSSTSGSQSSGSSPSGSTTNSGSGTTTNTTNTSTSGGSGNGPETSPDTYTKPASSGSTSSSRK
jgi:RNA polymerase sigma factor (sigma-70 family)